MEETIMAQYTSQFKLQIAKEALKAQTYTEITRKYGMHASQVKRWTDAYVKYGELAFEEDGPQRYQEQKIRDLEKELAELREENEILKKATAYFSKRNL